MAPTTDSCSRGQENSDASDCESDCQVESAALDWPMEDDVLKRSDALTQEEVIQRRLKRMRKLMKLYRSQYWSLVEEMRMKYRRFYLRYGKSGWRDDVEEKEDGGDGMREPERGNAENIHCGAQGCTAKPLALSVFCFAHILLEPRQRLYKPCGHVVRTNEKNGRETTCGKPVLRAVVPPLCVPHFHQAQRQANRSLNKVLPGGVKFNPKIHLLIAQYVKVIQNKRRTKKAALSAAKAAAAAAKVEANGEKVPPTSSQAEPPQPSGVGTSTTAEPSPAHHDVKKVLPNGQAKQNGVLAT
jgi:hypothetical protein